MKDYIEAQFNKNFTNHSLLLGMVGSGKTDIAKMKIHKHLKDGKKVFVLDFYQQYKEFQVHGFKNQLVIRSTEEICLFEFIPTIDFSSEEENEMYSFEYNLFCVDKMHSLFNLFEHTLTHEENKSLLNTLVTLFETIGITEHHYTPQDEFPNLDDFLCILKKENHTLYQEIAHFKSFFSARNTTLRFTDTLDYLSLNVDCFVKGEKELLLHTLLLILKQQIRRQPKGSVVVIDGLESFAVSEPIANELVLMMKTTGKKYGMMCLFIHHSLTELLKQCGEGVLSNANTIVCFKQAEMERECLKEYFDLYEEQINELIHLPKGQALAIHSSIVAKLFFPKR